MKNVTIVQRVLPHYRVEIIKQLRAELLDSDVNLTLLYGQHKAGSVPETVKLDYDWAIYTPNRYFNLLSSELVYQKLPRTISHSDLVIIEQANRLLSNYLLLIKRYTQGLKIAYWGHGKNFQSQNSGRIKSVFKMYLLTKVDWWFAYTKLSADIVESCGYSKDRISILNNSIDNEAFSAALRNVDEQDISNVYKDLNIRGKDICLYCGGLYPDKKIDFLIRASEYIRQSNPEFELIIIGDGPDKDIAETAMKSFDWVHYIGPQYGNDRARYFRVSKLLLMPGLVGLAILDSFISSTPIITTDLPIHSPEISYLENGINGLMCSYNESEYSNTVINCLRDQKLFDQLIQGCKVSSSEYTIDKMVHNFKSGIVDSLKMRNH